MKMKRTRFEQIVKEELIKHLRELREGEPEEDGDQPPEEKPKAPKGDQKASGDKKDAAPKGKAPKEKPAPKKGPEAPPMAAADDDGALPEVPDEPDPADDELDGGPDDEMPADEPADAEGSGGLNDQLSGKTVQAITIEPKSKLLPGAKEVVISFNEVTDPLKILITSTGGTKFFYRGKISDIP